jgi:hypothetical protein
MAKRASVPEGKALFFRAPEIVEPEVDDEPDVRVGPPSVDLPVEPLTEARAASKDRAREAERGSEKEREGEREKAPSRQSAIFLQEDHLDWLEDRCRDARRNGGRAIRKAAIIRALLDVAMESPVDLRGLKKEEDLKDRLRRGLRG